MDALLKEVPGRVWEGKEAVLEAVAVVGAAACSGSSGKGPHAAGLSPEQCGRAVSALLDAAGKKKAEYRKAALQQLEVLLTALGGGSGGGGSGSGGGGSGSGGGGGNGVDHYASVAPLLLELIGAFVAAQGGPASMDTDQPAAGEGGGQQQAATAGGGGEGAGEGAGGAGSGGAVPAAEVVACLGAAFGTAGPGAVGEHGAAAAGAVASLLAAAAKAADQAAAVAAGIRIAEHVGRLAAAAAPAAAAEEAPAGAAAGVSSAGPAAAAAAAAAAVAEPASSSGEGGADGWPSLLRQALRMAGEGKAAQLREEGIRLCQLLLWQLWGSMAAEQRREAEAAVQELAARERLPALKSAAAALAAELAAAAVP